MHNLQFKLNEEIFCVVLLFNALSKIELIVNKFACCISIFSFTLVKQVPDVQNNLLLFDTGNFASTSDSNQFHEVLGQDDPLAFLFPNDTTDCMAEKKEEKANVDLENLLNEKKLRCKCSKVLAVTILAVLQKHIKMKKGLHQNSASWQKQVRHLVKTCKMVAQSRGMYMSSSDNEESFDYDDFQSVLQQPVKALIQKSSKSSHKMSGLLKPKRDIDLNEELSREEGKDRVIEMCCVEEAKQNEKVMMRPLPSPISNACYGKDECRDLTNEAEGVEKSNDVIEVNSLFHNPLLGPFDNKAQTTYACGAFLCSGGNKVNDFFQKDPELYPKRHVLDESEIQNNCSLLTNVNSNDSANWTAADNDWNVGFVSQIFPSLAFDLPGHAQYTKDIFEEVSVSMELGNRFEKSSLLVKRPLLFPASCDNQCVDGNNRNEKSNNGNNQKQTSQAGSQNNDGNVQSNVGSGTGQTSRNAGVGNGGDDPDENSYFRPHNGHYDEVVGQDNPTDNSGSDNEASSSNAEAFARRQDKNSQTRQERIGSPPLQDGMDHNQFPLHATMDNEEEDEQEHQHLEQVDRVATGGLLFGQHHQIQPGTQGIGHSCHSENRKRVHSQLGRSCDSDREETQIKRLRGSDVGTSTSRPSGPGGSESRFDRHVLNQTSRLHPFEIPGRGPDGQNEIGSHDPVSSVASTSSSQQARLIIGSHHRVLGHGPEVLVCPSSNLVRAWNDDPMVVEHRRCNHCFESVSVFRGEVHLNPPRFTCHYCLDASNNYRQAIPQHSEQNRTFVDPPRRVTIRCAYEGCQAEVITFHYSVRYCSCCGQSFCSDFCLHMHWQRHF